MPRRPLVVVGGANSAGQAAIFLAGRVSHVDLVVRRGDLAASKSRYLIDQVEANRAIDLHVRTEIRELHGDRTLEAITVERTTDGRLSTIETRALFVFIGSDPCTSWLDGALAVDDDGFILTGQDLQLTHLDPADVGSHRAPLSLETSRPGVFAAGDVRSGSVKRVASAVGEWRSASSTTIWAF